MAGGGKPSMPDSGSEAEKPSRHDYPSEFMDYAEAYAFGGIRIYEVSEAQAKKIVEEFPSSFPHEQAYLVQGDRLFYMNVNRGQQHFIFSLPTSRG
jgi:hypothetical protein